MIWKFKYRKQAFSFLKENNFVEIVRDKIFVVKRLILKN